MREDVRDYLAGAISRRDFVGSLTAAGFSLAAARSALGEIQHDKGDDERNHVGHVDNIEETPAALLCELGCAQRQDWE